MTLSTVTAARSRRLTTVRRVQDTLGLEALTDPGLIESLVDASSAAIESYCHRPFARETYSETLPGYGDIHLILAATPIISISAVYFDSGILTDYSIADKDAGLLYRRAGWAWTAQRFFGLTGSGSFMDLGWPLSQQEEPTYRVDYTAGYLMPYTASTISAASADNSINDSAGLLPAGAVAGDVITVSGFQNAANKASFTIGAAPTTSKWILTGGTLVTEAAGEVVTVTGLPADLEKAAIEATKSYYQGRTADSTVVEKAAGPMRLRYSEGGSMDVGIPPMCVGLLRPWVRSA